MCEDNIGTDVTEALNDVKYWIHLTQDRNHCLVLVNVEMDLQVLQQARNF
jgi:hypothetical protein